METKYDLFSNRELINELKRRGLRPFEGGKRWNQKYLMKQRLQLDDQKKTFPQVDNAQTPQIRYDERFRSNDE